MDTNPRSAAIRSAALTSALIAMREIARDVRPELLSEEQIALLHEIANFAIANAQEARWLRDEFEASVAQAIEYERCMQAKIAMEADAADHHTAHML